MLEQDMDKVNDQERKLDNQIMKLVEQYASCDRRSAEINDERKQIRDNAEKLGFASSEFQEGVKRSKKMTKTERDVYEEHVGRIVGIVEGKQAELWPTQAEKNQKREERKAEKAAKEPRGSDELDAATDANPKSDPAAGGAGKKRGSKKDKGIDIVSQSGVATEEVPLTADKPWPDDVAANAAAEQTEGEALLATAGKGDAQGLTGTTGLGSVADERPLSQSAQAAAVREQLGLDKA